MISWRLAGFCALGVAISLSWASAQCPDADVFVGEVQVEGLGSALFGNFRSNVQLGTFEFYDGVCLTDREAGWTITGKEMFVFGLESGSDMELRIPEPTMFMDNWTIEALEVQSVGTDLIFKMAWFKGPKFSGTATEIQFNLVSFQAMFKEVGIIGEQFIAQGDRALLDRDNFTIFDGSATTCVCDGDPFYRLRGTGVDLDLDTGAIILHNGLFELGAIRYSLGEKIELNETSFAELIPDINFRYVGPDPSTGEPGASFEVTASEIRLAPGLDFSLSLASLQGQPGLRGSGKIHLQAESVDAEFGLSHKGPRFSFLVREEVARGVRGSFQVRNVHEAASDYLHEGVLSFEANLVNRKWASGPAANLVADAFSAVSSQSLSGDPIAGLRLGIGIAGSVHSGFTSWGRFSFDGRVEMTGYPTLSKTQFGLSVEPSWELRLGPTEGRLSYTGILTNGGSPFTVAVDRLLSTSRANLSATVQGELFAGGEGRFSIQVAYDFLRRQHRLRDWNAEGELRLNAGRSVFVGNTWIRSGHEIQRTGSALIVGASAGLESGKLEAGLWAEYVVREAGAGLEELGVHLALPFHYKDFVVTPFASLNLASSIINNEGPSLLGHGVEVEWASCCGTLTAGYRQERNVFRLLLGLRF